MDNVNQIIHFLLKTAFQVKKAILIVYVHGIILIGDHIEEIQRLKEFLPKEFEIKNLEMMKYFLGMKVARLKRKTSIS